MLVIGIGRKNTREAQRVRDLASFILVIGGIHRPRFIQRRLTLASQQRSQPHVCSMVSRKICIENVRSLTFAGNFDTVSQPEQCVGECECKFLTCLVLK